MATGADADFFAAQWGLDEAAKASLLQLDVDLQVKVISDFSPKPGTRDVNRLFHGFLKSVRTTAAIAQPSAAEGSDTVALQDVARSSAEEKTTGWHVQTDMIDVEAFLNRWGLDEAAHAMIVEQAPEVQARVMAEFAPKPGTRDVNRLLHGFIRSVRNSAAPPPGAGHAGRVAVEAEEPREQEAADDYAAEAAAAQEEALLIDEAVYRYETDESVAQQEEEALYYTTSPGRAYHVAGRGLPRSAVPQPSSTPRLVDVPSFVAQWNLDSAAQAALQQLAPEVQAKVLADFAPKPGTRDVNRLFHGFIRSVLNTSLTQAQGAAAPAAMDHAAQPAYVTVRAPAHHAYATAPAAHEAFASSRLAASHAYAAGAAAPAASTWPSGSEAQAQAPRVAQPAPSAGQTERLQAFVDHWGLDAGSVADLVQLPADMQTRVVTEFAPKPHTQDINRLFRGFIRSVLTTGGGQRHPRVYTILKQDLQAEAPEYGNGTQGTYAAYVGGHAADTFADETGAFNAQQGYAEDGAKREFDGTEEGPTHEEMDNFIRGWSLGDECLVTLEGQSVELQRRVLDQFRPKPGTRDVRSLFFGFIRSLASGGGKRARTA
mmetsp:Transcript_4886/g.14188  ORF Transcript_4886/g.14188 Transcript_4886/m.14188 type:complete len:600 (-) Transcript_4886:59-1858(-)